MKKYLSLTLLCGLLLAGTLTATPAYAQAPVNPTEEMAKFITPAQKKKVDSAKLLMDQKLVVRFGAVQANVTKKLYELAGNSTYQPKFEEAEKLSEPEQGAKKKEIWNEISEEARPGFEKEIKTTLRGIINEFLADSEKIMTAAQKPKFAKVKARVIAEMDREIGKSSSAIYDSFVPKKE
jgi:Zn-dependent M16 (insulinase) family peptidase